MGVVHEPHYLRVSPGGKGREEYYRQGVGPSGWLKVIVDFSGQGIVWTAHPQRKGPV